MINKIALIVLLAATTGCGRNHYEYFSGANGTNGVDGSSCSVSNVDPNAVAPNGGSMISCAASSTLILNGTNGSNGFNGSNGTNGTSISSVTFCPGATVYPSTFIEVGFIIAGKLYAVYSANGGFMTQIVPGNYSSNAIGSSCSFTVNADLTISH